jgi:hypothetical protein
MGTPTEQVGFQASEEYTSRISSPRPLSWAHNQAHSSTSHPHVDSPLRKEGSSGHVDGKAEFEGALSKKLGSPSDAALESEVEDEDTIHVDAPGRRISKIYGGAGHLDSTEDLGPYAGHGDEDGIHDERGYGAPILASDEVAKEPFGWELQPAVSPSHERNASYFDDHSLHPRSGSASSSRTPSRPGSIHGGLSGQRLPADRPLEALDEYEPLFSEGEEEKEGGVSEKRPLTAADKLKRPELKVSLLKSCGQRRANRSRTANSQAKTSGKIPQTAYSTLPRYQHRNCPRRRKRIPGSSQLHRARHLSKPSPRDRRSWLRRKPKNRRASSPGRANPGNMAQMLRRNPDSA